MSIVENSNTGCSLNNGGECLITHDRQALLDLDVDFIVKKRPIGNGIFSKKIPGHFAPLIKYTYRDLSGNISFPETQISVCNNCVHLPKSQNFKTNIR